MLTPQEVAEHSFAKASFSGYNMAMVDDFLDALTADYESLYNDNALLKQKLGILSGKMREYQSTEEAMRKTLLAAQTMADEMVKQAEQKRDVLLQEVETSAKKMADDLRREVEAEQVRLTAARNATAAYTARIKELCEQQLTYITSLDKLMPPLPPQSNRVEEAARDIEQAVLRTIEQAQQVDLPVVPAETDELPESADGVYDVTLEDTNPTIQVPESGTHADKFASLGQNFGSEYEIK